MGKYKGFRNEIGYMCMHAINASYGGQSASHQFGPAFPLHGVCTQNIHMNRGWGKWFMVELTN